MKNNRIKMNLQLFAEPAPETAPETTSAPETPSPETELTTEQLMEELARARAERAKFKASLDKALSDKGNLTKQLRAKMTAEELESEAKAEEERLRAEEMQNLRQEIASMKATNRYQRLGMPEELVKEAVEAEMSGDFEGFEAVFVKFKKIIKDEAIEELLKSRPDIATGNGDGSKYSAGIEKAKQLAQRQKTTTRSNDILKNYI